MPKFDPSIVFVADAKYIQVLRVSGFCHKCLKKLEPGDRVRRGGRKGKIKMWHENCYKEY